MERLTTSQIQDFNNPLAFARKRTQRVGQTQLTGRTSNTLRTNDIEESYRLVTGASERLKTLSGNLHTMLDLARQGQRIRGNQRKLQEVYGKLRSLSAGFDQVVDAIQFKGNPVFSGKDLILSLGTGSKPLEIDAMNLHTYGDSSLNLSESDPNAKATIRYNIEDVVLNEAYSLVGLDLEEANYIPGSNGALELENGKYKVKISYEGADSTVELQTLEGVLIEKQEGVDLSGSGREWVDFDAGIRLSFAKDQILQSIDKYDFEAYGPAYLSATLTYERVHAHTLRTSEGSNTKEIAEFLYDPILTSDSGGTLKALNSQVTPVAQNKSALPSGTYTLAIEYRGENSYIRLSDSLGRLRGYAYGVDLSTEGTTKVDLGVGVSFEINNDGYSGNASLRIPLQYEHPSPALDDFNFREYAKRIEAAIKVVEEESAAMSEAIAEIEEFNRLRNSAATSATPNLLAFNSSSALSILSQPSFGPKSFDPAASQARTSLLANQLFSSTTALPAQANQSPEALASLQNASKIGFVGFFA